jgi:hypothetical protein
MEGGMLTHALRIAKGEALYAEPASISSASSQPLYPAVLAALSKIFGLSYVLGRTVSILSFGGALAVLVAAVRGVAKDFESAELRAQASAAGLLGAAACASRFVLRRLL